jgi:pimeloyl-ACP methyl ester carboxylesterase
MRLVGAVLLCVLVTAAPASGQALDSEFVHGRDYAFERMAATRAVNDADDKGTIRLVTYVYRPLKNDRREVMLFSHGSTGGLLRSAREPLEGPPPALIRFFVSRGYTLVIPMRRGRAESTGTYVEECSVYAGQCTVEDQLALSERAIREARMDIDAVIDQLILGKLVPPTSTIVAAGISRGGFLSLILAGERPALVKGVINFVGGWHGVTERLSAAQNEQRMNDHRTRLVRAAKQARAPSIWFYASRDPLYKDGVPQELYRCWQDAGGRAEFVFVAEHSLPSGHAIATNGALWQRQADAFLKTVAKTGQ